MPSSLTRFTLIAGSILAASFTLFAVDANALAPKPSAHAKPPATQGQRSQKEDTIVEDDQAEGRQKPPTQKKQQQQVPDLPNQQPPAVPGDPTPIKQGLSVGGVKVGDLTVDQASKRIEEKLTKPLARSLKVTVAGKEFRLKMTDIDLKMDVERSARRALSFGQSLQDPTADMDIPVAVTYSQLRLERFVNHIAREVNNAPVNAYVKIRVDKIIKRYSKHGRSLDMPRLTSLIAATVADPIATRDLAGVTTRLSPKIKYKDLARQNPTIITIDRSHFRLRLFKNLRLVKSYGVAVGQSDYPTPRGDLCVREKAVNPVWTAPKKAWAGSYAGKQIPGGAPDNPLKARWIGIGGGVGIHGTASTGSIGSRATHACIRMLVPDVINLYKRVRVGDPVIIR